MLSKNGKALRNPKLKTGSHSECLRSEHNSWKPRDIRYRSYKQMPEPRLYKQKPRSKTTVPWEDTDFKTANEEVQSHRQNFKNPKSSTPRRGPHESKDATLKD